MRIKINDKEQTIPEETTVAQLIIQLGLSGKACAAEVNTKLIPKAKHESHTLSEGDRVELVTLVGGG